MPRIKVYKGSGEMIPVTDAKIATAFRCPWTKKVYATKQSYVKHLKHLRENYMHKRIRAKAVDLKKQNLWNQPSFEDIIKWIEMNPEFMFDNGYRQGWHRFDDKAIREQFWVKITYLNIQWSNSVSNSHSCPRGGVTNWGSHKNDLPRGYPGFHGRIEYQMSHNIGFGSDIMRNLCIHTGTGGGINNNRFGYEVKFFDSDWPGLEKSRVLKILGSKDDWKTVRYGTPEYFR